jgi:hypothetical protein
MTARNSQADLVLDDALSDLKLFHYTGSNKRPNGQHRCSLHSPEAMLGHCSARIAPKSLSPRDGNQRNALPCSIGTWM